MRIGACTFPDCWTPKNPLATIAVPPHGEVAERLNAPVSKTGDGSTQEPNLHELTNDTNLSRRNAGRLDPESDPELARVVAAWNELPEPIRRAIVAMVEASASDQPSAGPV